ncbi:MAG TPA: hypothetical protein VGQ44_09875 [Gemmatimonadaceae bacterium]|jgi:hypothetical protein|nr:hypothetical protein [Gemmatimonadaceae bacterium]
MRLSRWIAVTVFPVVAVVTAARSGRTSHDPAGDHVRRHLDSVLVELRTNHLAGAGDARLARRARLIEELADYRNRGAYPHNYDFPGRLVPYFKDRETGALCAVGDLLAFTGRQDIVDRVVRLDNNVRVAELASDTAFRAWLDDNGLTLAEAARIQVVYAQSVSPAQMAGTFAVGLGASLGSFTSLSTTLANATANRNGQSKKTTIWGLASSGVTLAAGVALLHSTDFPRRFGTMATTIGATGLAVSGLALHNHNRLERETTTRNTIVALAPTLDLGAGNQAPRLGGEVSIRF